MSDTDAVMSSTVDYLYTNNKEYRHGYNAACAQEDRDPAKSKDWLAGFNQALIDLSKGQ